MNATTPRVIVIGAGISGLAAAVRVKQRMPRATLTVLEAGPRAGGALRTEEVDGYLIERGPDSILAEKPAAAEFAAELGIDGELVGTRPDNRGAYVVCRGKLEPIPPGFSLLAPTAFAPFFRSPILSWRGKFRTCLDLVLPRGGPTEEESLESFVTRRFGRELFERLAQPLAGGIYGADPMQLSLDATMPRFREAERAGRSVILGLRESQKNKRVDGAAEASSHGARYGMFVSFGRGVGRLPERAAEFLGEHLVLNAPVKALEKQADGTVRVHGTGRSWEADLVVVAVPASAASCLLQASAPSLSEDLGTIAFGSAVTVALAFDADQIAHPMDAYGYVVPTVEGRNTMAATWMSKKWPGRAPAGKELIRVFLGGHGKPECVDWEDEQLVDAAVDDLRQLLGVRGEPELVRVDRWNRKMPQYLLGHRDTVTRLEAKVAALGNVRLAGNSYRGVGIPDAISRGRETADALLEQWALHP